MPVSRKPISVRVNFELWLTVSAVVISVCALVVSVVQTRIAREQQKASVWPYLQFSSDRLDEDFILRLENKGVGPAIVRDVEVRFDRKTYRSHVEIFQKKEQIFGFSGPKFWKTIDRGAVLKAGEDVELFTLGKDNALADRLQRIVRDSGFVFRVTYADVYGNCWQVERDRVTELGRCSD